MSSGCEPHEYVHWPNPVRVNDFLDTVPVVGDLTTSAAERNRAVEIGQLRMVVGVEWVRAERLPHRGHLVRRIKCRSNFKLHQNSGVFGSKWSILRVMHTCTSLSETCSPGSAHTGRGRAGRR